LVSDGFETGTVKWFNVTKGFGFVIPDHGSEELFVHANQLAGLVLKEGDRIRYLPRLNPRNGKMRPEQVSLTS
jgi:CspA family cold shock protein